jgi:hypothetical protein
LTSISGVWPLHGQAGFGEGGFVEVQRLVYAFQMEFASRAFESQLDV